MEAMTQRFPPHHRQVPPGVGFEAAISDRSDDFVIVASAGVPRRRRPPLARRDLQGGASGAMARLVPLLVRDAPF